MSKGYGTYTIRAKSDTVLGKIYFILFIFFLNVTILFFFTNSIHAFYRNWTKIEH